MAEWSIAAVLKTADVQASVGSNPTPSASFFKHLASIKSASRAPVDERRRLRYSERRSGCSERIGRPVQAAAGIGVVRLICALTVSFPATRGMRPPGVLEAEMPADRSAGLGEAGASEVGPPGLERPDRAQTFADARIMLR